MKPSKRMANKRMWATPDSTPDFVLDADRLIARGREVAFMLSGSDEPGAQGQALLNARLCCGSLSAAYRKI
jgi:hypothetical protein